MSLLSLSRRRHAITFLLCSHSVNASYRLHIRRQVAPHLRPNPGGTPPAPSPRQARTGAGGGDALRRGAGELETADRARARIGRGAASRSGGSKRPARLGGPVDGVPTAASANGTRRQRAAGSRRESAGSAPQRARKDQTGGPAGIGSVMNHRMLVSAPGELHATVPMGHRSDVGLQPLDTRAGGAPTRRRAVRRHGTGPAALSPPSRADR